MDNVLRCSIIFMILHMFSINSGLASINPIANTMYNKDINRQPNRLDSIFSDESDDRDVASRTNFDNYDFDDYYPGAEELDSNKNTQRVDSDYGDNEYDEYLMSADKRSRHVPRRRQGKRTEEVVDLCPTTEVYYQLDRKLRLEGYKLLLPYKEHPCNHTRAHKEDRNYDRQFNRVCYSVGSTFEYGNGTHCYQRYRQQDIEARSTGKPDIIYTETHFRDGCTCGWDPEYGPIQDYHLSKILNLCSEIQDRI